MPRAQGEALWRRFKAAHDEVWARCEAHFAAQAEARADEPRARNRRSAERAEALAESTQLDSDRRRDQEAAGRMEDHRAGDARAGESDLGSLPRRVRSLLHAPARRSRRAQDRLGREPREERSAVRAARKRSPSRPTGNAAAAEHQTAAGRVEDDRPGQEDARPRRSGSGSAPPAIASSRATRSATTSRARNASPRAKRLSRSSSVAGGRRAVAGRG